MRVSKGVKSILQFEKTFILLKSAHFCRVFAY